MDDDRAVRLFVSLLIHTQLLGVMAFRSATIQCMNWGFWCLKTKLANRVGLLFPLVEIPPACDQIQHNFGLPAELEIGQKPGFLQPSE